MNQILKKSSWITVLMLAGMASISLAQELPAAKNSGMSGRGASGFVTTLERKVGLTPEQRDAVRGLLAEQRLKSQALRQETDQKIRRLLNPSQQTKFDEMLAAQKARFTRSK